MTVQLAPSPVFQAFGSNGAPLAFGQVSTYIAGTTTPQATWPDSTQGTPNPNPVVLNAFGQASIWLATTLVYKIVVQDALGNQLYVQDQIAGGAFAVTTTVSGSIIPTPTNTLTLGNVTNSWANVYVGDDNAPIFDPVTGNVGYYDQTAAEAAASVTPTSFYYPPLDIRRYGGDPTGVAASDTALANALLVCGTAGGTIRAPAGTYKFANQINLTSKRCITIEGDGGNTNNASAATTFTYSGTTTPFVIMGSSFGCSLRKMVFLTSNAGFTGAFVATSQVSGNPFMNSMEDMFLSCASQCTGLSLDTANTFLCKRVVFDHGKPCLTGQNAAGGSFSNVILIIDCQFQQATGSYSIGQLGNDWAIIGNTFEPGGDGVMSAIQNNTTTPCAGLVVNGNFFGDATTSSSPISLSGTGIQISGNQINAGSATGSFPTFGNVGPGITLTTARGVAITGNSFSNCNVIVTFGDANCKAIRVTENYCTNTNTLFGAYNTNAPYDLQFNPNYNASSGAQDFIPAAGSLFGSIAVNGFEVSQNGVIRMWGQKTVTAGTPLAITFSTEVGRAFPNACFQADCWFGAAPGASATGTYTSSTSATGTTLNVAGGTATNIVNWQAVGN